MESHNHKHQYVKIYLIYYIIFVALKLLYKFFDEQFHNYVNMLLMEQEKKNVGELTDGELQIIVNGCWNEGKFVCMYEILFGIIK